MANLVSDLINEAFLNLGAISPGETITASEQADGLMRLNQMIGSWSAEQISIYQMAKSTVALTGAASYSLTGAARPVKIASLAVSSTVSESLALKILTPAEWAQFVDKSAAADFGEVLYYSDGYPLGTLFIAPKASAGTLELLSLKSVGPSTMQVRETLTLTGAASYTIGAGGVFAVERPIQILGASIAAGSVVTQAVQLVGAELWAAFPAKGVGGSFPKVAWYDGGYPTGTLYVAPKPAAGTLEVYGYNAISQFAAVGSTVDLPMGYEQALVWNLALILYPQYGRTGGIDPVLAANAKNSKESIIAMNASIFGPGSNVTTSLPQPAPPVIVAKQ